MLRRDKQAELDSLCCELEENEKKGNSRVVFQTVKNLTKPFKPRTVAIKARQELRQEKAHGTKTSVSKVEGILRGTVQ